MKGEKSGVTDGGTGGPRLLIGKFLLTYQEKRGEEKGKRVDNGEVNKENCKREGGKLKMKGGKVRK